MILKIRQEPARMGADSGWLWIDQIESVRSHGYLADPDQNSENPNGFLAAISHEEIAQALEKTWGKHRDFEREIWPHSFKLESQLTSAEKLDVGLWISTYVATKRDGNHILVIIADEAFILSDDGKTVDRLR